MKSAGKIEFDAETRRIDHFLWRYFEHLTKHLHVAGFVRIRSGF